MVARLMDSGTSLRMGGSAEKSEKGDVILMARKRGHLFHLPISCSSNDCLLVHAERFNENDNYLLRVFSLVYRAYCLQ